MARLSQRPHGNLGSSITTTTPAHGGSGCHLQTELSSKHRQHPNTRQGAEGIVSTAASRSFRFPHVRPGISSRSSAVDHRVRSVSLSYRTDTFDDARITATWLFIMRRLSTSPTLLNGFRRRTFRFHSAPVLDQLLDLTGDSDLWSLPTTLEPSCHVVDSNELEFLFYIQ